jgi:hypothetical protein
MDAGVSAPLSKRLAQNKNSAKGAPAEHKRYVEHDEG